MLTLFFHLAFGLFLMLLCVGVHYEFLWLASWTLAQMRRTLRWRVVLGVLFALTAHLIEITIFSFGWVAVLYTGQGALSAPNTDFETIVYFSMSTYTSLGYGDIVPSGSSRLIAGLEALTGLVLIAWTASFTYLEMQRYWEKTDRSLAAFPWPRQLIETPKEHRSATDVPKSTEETTR